VITKRTNTLLLLLLIVLISCKKENNRCFKSYGDITKEVRVTNAFSFIELDDRINLFLTQDSVHKIEVEAGENLLPLIKTEIENGKLRIYDRNMCYWFRGYDKEINVYVSYVELDSMRFSGAGTISTTNTMKGDYFMLNLWGAGGSVNMNVDLQESHFNIHTGTGDITLKGKSTTNYAYSASNGFLFLSELETSNTFLSSNGTGDFYVYATSAIGVQIYGPGSVFYSGNPDVLWEIDEGEGNLVKQ